MSSAKFLFQGSGEAAFQASVQDNWRCARPRCTFECQDGSRNITSSNEEGRQQMSSKSELGFSASNPANGRAQTSFWSVYEPK